MSHPLSSERVTLKHRPESQVVPVDRQAAFLHVEQQTDAVAGIALVTNHSFSLEESSFFH